MNFIEHLRADEGNTAGSHSAMVRNAYLVANYASETSLVHESIKSNTYHDLLRLHPFVDFVDKVHTFLKRIGRSSTVWIQP